MAVRTGRKKNSRFLIKDPLDGFNPWKGYRTTDLLNGNDYLLFSLSLPEDTPLALEDLEMRNTLFSASDTATLPVLSLEMDGGDIFFLMPEYQLDSLPDSLKEAGGDKVKGYIRNITSTLIRCWNRKLYFSNLAPGNIKLIDGHPVILPSAYLLPDPIMAYISGAGKTERHPLLEDISGLVSILDLFGRYMENDGANRMSDIAAALGEAAGSADNAEIFKTLGELRSFLDIKDDLAVLPLSIEWMAPPQNDIEEEIARSAAGVVRGRGKLILLEGSAGSGKSCMLKIAGEIFKRETGLRPRKLREEDIFSAEAEIPYKGARDCVLVDDHMQDSLLCCFIVHRVIQLIREGAVVICVISGHTPDYFTGPIEEECGNRGVAVDRIGIPEPGRESKSGFFEKRAAPTVFSKAFEAVEADESPVWIDYAIASFLKGGLVDRPMGKDAVLGSLGSLERSILNFFAVFKFDLPLSILKSVYSTAENEFYESLQNLINIGMVTVSAGRSVAGKDICLLFGLSSLTLEKEILETENDERIKQLHSNIAFILKENPAIPSAYSLFHLKASGDDTVAAARCYETFRRFLGGRDNGATECLFRSFEETGLYRHLPSEMYSQLLIDIGNQFSQSGHLFKAQGYFEACRSHIGGGERGKKLRPIMVEAIRKECEILEKKGDFLKAEELLNEVIETHMGQCTVKEKCKLINDLAWVYYRLGQFDESWQNCLHVQKLLDKKQHPSELAQSYNLMGTINWNRSKYEEAILCHTKCLDLREEVGDPTGIASSFNNLGLVYRSTGRIEQAIDCFTKSMKIKEKANNLPGLAAAHLNLSLTYLDIEDIEEAEINCKKACRLAEDTGNQQLLGETYGTLGEISYLRGDFETARDYYYRDLHICKETKSTREEAIALRRLTQLHLATGEIEAAENLLAEARKLNKRIGSHLETALLNELDGVLKIKTGLLEEGIAKLEGSSVELSLLGRKNIAAKIAARLGEIYLEEKNEPLAREYLLRSISLAGKNRSVPNRIANLQRRLDKLSDSGKADRESGNEGYKTLCRFISTIRTISEPAKLYDSIMKTAAKVTGSQRAFIAFRGRTSENYTVVASSGGFEQGEYLDDPNIISIIDIARQLGYPLDTSRISIPLDKVGDDFLRKYPRILCIPLKLDHEVKGCLYLDSTTRSKPREGGDRSLLLAMTQQLAIGLERAFLDNIISSADRNDSSLGVKKPGQSENYMNIIRKSEAMAAVCELIDGIKEMDTTVLLTGKSGSGKDLIAKTIHYSSSRKDFPFHSINCSALPGELLESELFGHERGSFTGAHKQKIGHFESAGKGTIFLNEIGDLPLSLQPKLLHAIEERNFFRVGGTKNIQTTARIITATNKDLKELVKKGQFREDLFYRINIFPIKVPSLKERKEDIEPLSRHFLKVYCKLYDLPVKRFSPEAVIHLKRYDWPGNVRELESTIIRLIIVTDGDTITLENLPENITGYSERYQEEISSTLKDRIEGLIENIAFSTTDPILPKIEKMLIQNIVDRTGNMKKAAALLGISKPTLYARLRNYEKNGD